MHLAIVLNRNLGLQIIIAQLKASGGIWQTCEQTIVGKNWSVNCNFSEIIHYGTMSVVAGWLLLEQDGYTPFCYGLRFLTRDKWKGSKKPGYPSISLTSIKSVSQSINCIQDALIETLYGAAISKI